MRRPVGRALLTALLAAVALCASPALARADFSAAAATVDVSPRAASAGDPNAFGANPACAAMTGPRLWADDEPYVDVNANGKWDPGEPFCDSNGNGRHDQIYDSGASIGSPRPAGALHDPLDARAFAISDGSRTVVIVSVVAQGIFKVYTDRMAALGKQLATQRGARVDAVIVSANHNESSPDTIGIYGGPAPPMAPAGAQSGIDDYYMNFLVAQVGEAIARAATSLRPATLNAIQFPLPATLMVRLSDNWPTTTHVGQAVVPTAIDPKVGVLQARDAGGAAIFTVMSLAAHNQEIGHGSGTADLSSDWPGYFQRSLEQRVGGQGVFLVADNGSEEDPGTLPAVGPEGTYAQAKATGEAFAAAVAGQAPQAQPLRFGPIGYAQADECVALENNLFRAAAAAGLFGPRPSYAGSDCTQVVAPSAGPPTALPDHLLSGISLLDVGPDLELIANPGEPFPALMLGSPFGFEDVPSECNARPNPGVPTWRSHGLFRFHVGLANDLIGYELPAWAFIGSYGTFTSANTSSGPGAGANCQTGSPQDPTASVDSKGHKHKLESEGAGPTASSQVADGLTALVAADAPDPSAGLPHGRFVQAGGGYSRSPIGASAILLPDAGATALDPAGGRLIGAPGVAGFGGRAVDATGLFMDYDGQPQDAPDVTTRGIVLFDSHGCVSARHYLDVFPALDGSRGLGGQVSGPRTPPAVDCPNPGAGGIPGVQRSVLTTLAQAFGGGPGAIGAGAGARACTAGRSLRSTVSRGRRRRRLVVVRSGRSLRVRGGASSGRCSAPREQVARVTVAIARRAGRRCRFVTPRGKLGATRPCGQPVLLLARGTTRWSLRLRLRIPRGAYRVSVRAVDAAGEVEHRRRGGTLRLRVR